MTITFTRKKLNKLKTSILADGRVDEVEVQELLEFIEPYVDVKIGMFVEFNTMLRRAISDGKIDADESAELVCCIERLSKRLLLEQAIEWLFFGSLVLLIIGAIIFK